VVSCKLMRPAIKGHDTANYERVQLLWVLTHELVGLGCFWNPLHRDQVGLCSTAGRVATGLVDSQSGMVAQGLDSK